MRKRKNKVDRPYQGGTYTESELRAHIARSLRRAKIPSKYMALKRQFIDKRVNPRTKRLGNHYKCEASGRILPSRNVSVDHIHPIVPLDGKWGDTTSFLGYNWNEYIARMWCEPEQLQVLSDEEHKRKTEKEKEQRRKHRGDKK